MKDRKRLNLPKSLLVVTQITILLMGIFPAKSSPNQVNYASGPTPSSSESKPAVNTLEIEEIAQQITVRILTNPGAGSGVIVARKNQTYTVLTNDHVLAYSWDNVYYVLTADGQKHLARKVLINWGNFDLALLQFSSSNNYQVVEIRKGQDLMIGETVYASGFPNWHWVGLQPEDTRQWDLNAYKLTEGKLEMISDKSLARGYKIGYTNEVENGMSGGPILDSQGRLIGVNGRLKYPFQGMEAFQFADGSWPSEQLFQQMETLSWGIPATKLNFGQGENTLSRRSIGDELLEAIGQNYNSIISLLNHYCHSYLWPTVKGYSQH